MNIKPNTSRVLADNNDVDWSAECVHTKILVIDITLLYTATESIRAPSSLAC